MKLIVAVDENWGIGKEGGLLTSIPDDMRFFRDTTQRHILVMGSKTLRSFKNARPLPGRLNIVLTRSEASFAGAVVCRSTEQLLELLKSFNSDDIMVIGGGLIYRQLLPYCSKAYITKMRFNGEADAFMPNLDKIDSWIVAGESEVKEYEGISYSFTEYINADAKGLDFTGVCSDMSEYFKTKKLIDLEANESLFIPEIFSKLEAKLSAYFYPLKNGFSALDVDRFFKDNNGASFEEYLKSKSLIACEKDIAKLSTSSKKIRIKKEELQTFIKDVKNSVPLDILTEKYPAANE